MPCQAAITSHCGARASASTSGNAAINRRVFYRDPFHLCLLEHNLGDEDPVQVVRVAPEHVVTAVALVEYSTCPRNSAMASSVGLPGDLTARCR